MLVVPKKALFLLIILLISFVRAIVISRSPSYSKQLLANCPPLLASHGMASPRIPVVFAYVYILATLSSTFVLFPESSVKDYPTSSADALSANITECNNAVSAFDTSTAYSEQALDSLCTADCHSALQSWEDKIKDTCNGVTYADDYGKTVPISSIASQLNFNFNQTCLMDNGQYCNIILGNLTSSVNGPVGDKD